MSYDFAFDSQEVLPKIVRAAAMLPAVQCGCVRGSGRGVGLRFVRLRFIRHLNFREEIEMKHVLSAFCCIALCSVPVFAQGKSMKGSAMSDQQFVNFAAQTDMVEANLGQLADTAASSQAVKDYAQMLVTDHTKDFHQLYDASNQANLKVPDAIDAQNNRAMIAPFQKLKGTSFDQRYVRDMITGHTKAIAVYKKEAADAQNMALRSYAEDALPVLEKHLDGAKNLEKTKAAVK